MSPSLRHYFKIKDNLSYVDKLLFFGEKIVVPTAIKGDMLKLLHEGHFGIEKCKNRARRIFYWPGQSVDVEAYIKKCSICETFAKKQPKESLLPYELPNRPWERLGLDIFSHANKIFLIVFDSYSNWLETTQIKDKSMKSVILALKSIFSVHGSPDKITADNVPFDSREFKTFAKNWNFEIILRSPYYAQSNGLAEKGVDIGKNMLKKCLKENSDIHTALLQYRNSPLKYIGYSPAELLMSRICKTKVPINSSLLHPKLCEDVSEKLLRRQNIYRSYYDKKSKDLKPLEPKTNVTIFDHVKNKWEPAQIVSKHSSPRSYLVKDSFGNVIRRNRIDLKESLNEYVSKSNEPDINESSGEPLVQPAVSLKNKKPLLEAPPECLLSSPKVLDQDIKTRCGRVIKKPDKLNL
ncbi:uncharacterized protein K02A2.6-like [Diorhabda sublineata]|uniref:uncharacterized protein K02A2.6-like n=1 Tax=Diorhabda sublineata TaxID=1163346 RepID=UPI0024E10DA2|nr:uncharacterized protein K02A2.6-like [Diorhabda sublineata]